MHATATATSGCTSATNDVYTLLFLCECIRLQQGGAVYCERAGTVSVTNSTLDSNIALQAGGAIFGAELSIPTVTASIFSKNSASCCFAQGYGSSVEWEKTGNTCTDVDSGTALTAECCTVGSYTDGVQCVACDSSKFNCNAVGVSTESISLQAGLWRPTLQSVTVYQCWNADACIGGRAVQSVQNYCATGYKGPCKLEDATSFTTSFELQLLKCSAAPLQSVHTLSQLPPHCCCVAFT
jgi:hypothetical protein